MQLYQHMIHTIVKHCENASYSSNQLQKVNWKLPAIIHTILASMFKILVLVEILHKEFSLIFLK